MIGIRIEVKGDPIPLARPRAIKRGFYDPQYLAKKNFRSEVQLQFSQPAFNIPLHVTMEFYFKIPKSWSKKKTAANIGNPHIERRDLSNLVKFVEDALNTYCWTDDEIISKITAFKRWANEPKTIITIEEDKCIS